MSASQFGQMLRHLRHEKGATLSEVAAATGVSIPMLSRMERGERLPSSETLKALSSYYDTSARTLAEAAGHQHSLNRYADSWGEESASPILRAFDSPRAPVHFELSSVTESEAPSASAPAFSARPIRELFDLGAESSPEAVEDAAVAAEAAVKQLGREIRRSGPLMSSEDREKTRAEVRKLGEILCQLDDDRFWHGP